MCLVAKRRFPKISLRKIKVYKILNVSGHPPYFEYYTYRNGVNKPYPSGGFSTVTTLTKHIGSYFVQGNYLHAWLEKTDAKEVRTKYFKEYKIVEMYIPIFTRFYLGVDGDICAKKLVW